MFLYFRARVASNLHQWPIYVIAGVEIRSAGDDSVRYYIKLSAFIILIVAHTVATDISQINIHVKIHSHNIHFHMNL